MYRHSSTKEELSQVAETIVKLARREAEVGRSGAGFDLGNAEVELRRFMRRIENLVLQAQLDVEATNHDHGKTGNCRQCPQCDRLSLMFHRFQRGSWSGYSGVVHASRAYYYCKECGYGECPLDKTLGLPEGPWTPHLRDGLALTCALVPHQEGATWLSKTIPGLEVSAKAIEKVGVQEGEKLVQAQAAAAKKSWRIFENHSGRGAQDLRVEWNNTPMRDDVVYIETDGAMVNLREEKWSESRQIVVFWSSDCAQINEHRKAILRKRYVSQICNVHELRKLLWQMIVEEKVWNAKRIVVLGDGAPWIWKMVDELLPKATQILDFYHVSEKIWEVARALFPPPSERIREWATAQECRLKEGRVLDVVRALQKVRKRRNTKASVPAAKLIAYIWHNRRRIHYAAYRRDNLDIGSGAVEGANKTIVIARLRRAGMRWNRHSANAVLALRACFMSDQWDNRLKMAA